MQNAEGCYYQSPLFNPRIGKSNQRCCYAFEGAARMWLKDYDGALVAFNNTELSSSNYSLMSNFADANEYNHQNNDESLLKFKFEKKDGDPQDWVEAGNHPELELGWIDSFSWPQELTGQGYDYGQPCTLEFIPVGRPPEIADNCRTW